MFFLYSELSWVGAGWSPVRTILKERPQTEHFLLWSYKREHCSQVRCPSHLPTVFTHISITVTISFHSPPCSQHLLAQWMCTKGDYRNAMTHEKEALTAFTTLVSLLNRELSGVRLHWLHPGISYFLTVWGGPLTDTLQQRVPVHHHQACGDGGTLTQTGWSR